MSSRSDTLSSRARISDAEERAHRVARAQANRAHGDRPEEGPPERGEHEQRRRATGRASPRSPRERSRPSALRWDADHGAQDDVERDRAHRALDDDVVVGPPAPRLFVRPLAHDGAVGAHAIAMERRRHQLSFALVAIPREDEERVVAEQRLDRVHRERREGLGRCAEELLCALRRPRNEHVADRRELQHEGIPTRREVMREEPLGIEREVPRLDDRRQP